MKLICKLGPNKVKNVNISPKESLYILLKKLKLKDKKAKLVYNDKTYSIGSIKTFEEIGLTYDSTISIKVNRENIIEQQRIEFNEWKDTISCHGEPKKGDNIWNILFSQHNFPSILVRPKENCYLIDNSLSFFGECKMKFGLAN